MSNDPNWLYSTIAQSSAAIVAIIGGFITASILTLLAEKRSLSNQLKEMETRIDVLKKRGKEETEKYEAMRVDIFLDRIANDLKKEDKLPPLEELTYRYPGWHLDPKILKQEYEKLSKNKLEARDFITKHSDKINHPDFLLFDKWIKQNKLDISSYDYKLVEQEYYRFHSREVEAAEEEKRKNIPSSLRGMFEVNIPLTLPPSLQQSQWDLYRQQREDRRLEGSQNRIIGIKHEISLLEGGASSLESQIRSFSYPPNLRWGIFVLAYLAVFGILFPVLILASEVFFNWAKVSITATFWLGIIAVFSYVVFQIRALKK